MSVLEKNEHTQYGKKKELNPTEQLARAIIDQYQPKSVADMQNALKNILCSMFEAESVRRKA